MSKKILNIATLFAFLIGIGCTEDNTPQMRRMTPSGPATVSTLVVGGAATEVTIEGTLALNAVAQMSDGTMKDVTTEATWGSSKSDVATVDLIGGVTGKSLGVTTITASYEGKIGTIDITVLTDGPTNTLVVTPMNAVLEGGATQQMTATLLGSDGSMTDVTAGVAWNSSDTNIVQLDAAGTPGLATAGMTAGTATITATDMELGLTAKATITVSQATLVSLAISPTRATIPLGSIARLTVQGTYSDGMTADLTTMVTWSSSSIMTASVSNAPNFHGVVSTHSIGLASITATDESTGINNTITVTVTNPAVLTVKVLPRTASVGIGRNQAFEAFAIYSDASEINVTRRVEWSSSDLTIVSVSNQTGTIGTAIGLSVGTATITAFHTPSGVSSNDSGLSGRLTVVPAALTSIVVTPLQASIPLGDTQNFTATGLYSNGTSRDISRDVNWSSSNLAVATVSTGTAAPGIASTLSEGMATISAVDPSSGISSNDGMRSAELTVLPPELQSIEVQPLIANLAIMSQQQFRAIAHYSNNTQQDVTNSITWGSTNSNVLAVSNTGLGTANNVGTAIISARDARENISSDDTNESAQVTVAAANLVSLDVVPTSTSIPLGVRAQFRVTGNYDNGATAELTNLVDWTSTDPNIASVSNQAGTKGLVSSNNVGMATVSAREPSSGIDSNSSGSSGVVTVSTVDIQSIAISPTMPMPVRMGNTFQFTGMGTFTDGSSYDVTNSVQWNTSNPSIATITTSTINGGLMTGVMVGTASIAASLPMTTISSNSVSVEVTDPCGVEDLRIVEVHIGNSDYAQVINPTSCTLSLSGLGMKFDDNQLPDVSMTFPNNATLGPNGSIYVCESSVSNCGNVGGGGRANDVCLNSNIGYSGTSNRSGTTSLCNGSCSVAANIIDIHQFTGGSTPAPAAPTGISFSPAPQTLISGQSTRSYNRTTYTGSNPTFQRSDWTTGNKSR